MLTWVSSDADNDIAGSLILIPTKSGIWSGLQIYGHSLGDEDHPTGTIVSLPYLLSKKQINNDEWQRWNETLEEILIHYGMK